MIYSDAYSSEMMAYADLIPPDTTYLERHDCISLLTARFRGLTRPATRFDGRWWSLTVMCAGFQSMLIDFGARLGLPGFINEAGLAKCRDCAEHIAAGGFCQAHVPEDVAYFKPWHAAYHDFAVAMAFYEAPLLYLL